MPRKKSGSKQSSSEDVIEMLNNIEGGSQKSKIIMNELETRVETYVGSLQKATNDHHNALVNFFAVLNHKIPKHHQKMKVRDFLDMSRKEEDRSVIRQSFQVEIDQLCDAEPVRSTRGASAAKKNRATPEEGALMGPPTTGKISKKLCYPKTASSKSGHKNGSLKSTENSEPAATTSVRRSRRLNSTTTSLVSTPATLNNFHGVFTPKFDPRGPITPAQGLRKPNVGEKIVLMSQAGSPLSHHRQSLAGPTIIVPLQDGKAITISSETEIQNLIMDEDTQESLRFIQKKLASLANIPLSCLTD